MMDDSKERCDASTMKTLKEMFRRREIKLSFNQVLSHRLSSTLLLDVIYDTKQRSHSFECHRGELLSRFSCSLPIDFPLVCSLQKVCWEVTERGSRHNVIEIWLSISDERFRRKNIFWDYLSSRRWFKTLSALKLNYSGRNRERD